MKICRQFPVLVRYLCDGLEHIPPWFKPELQLAQQVAWFMHQLPLHPKMKFGQIHKISTSTQSFYFLFLI
jgi:hypothetical protein